MIVGLSKITEGSIYVGGCSVKDDSKGAMRNIVCIVENPDMYKYMSGMDNLKIFAKIYDGVDEARINEVVKIVDLEKAIKDKVKTYSLGMKQRLGIASALLHSPKLLIIDEPTNGLDPVTTIIYGIELLIVAFLLNFIMLGILFGFNSLGAKEMLWTSSSIFYNIRFYRLLRFWKT